MLDETAVRAMLGRLLSWEDAHAGFESAVKDFPPELRDARPEGLPYSPWQMVEHLRLAQHDILDFCRNPDYQPMEWPKAYWPASPEPPSDAAWDASVAAYLRDREALAALAGDTSIDLCARLAHGEGQTVLRELILAADHAAYHVGQLVLMRRLLGRWD
jgi:hypothetical protein